MTIELRERFDDLGLLFTDLQQCEFFLSCIGEDPWSDTDLLRLHAIFQSTSRKCQHCDQWMLSSKNTCDACRDRLHG